ncbi:MAG TPA: sigma-70 family RNA polymerase sigma factor [Steroidobacteraceae bacterium]|nr:sigma-70 family RNA polymerase sigma factor [Steroidobacteraceae bacterium]
MIDTPESSLRTGVDRSTHDESGDHALMQQFQDSGDGAAFRTLFLRHKDPLLAFLLRLSGRNDVAEDVSQQAWLKLLEVARRRGYRASEVASFRTFLFTLARNYYVDKHLRAHQATRVNPLSELHEQTLPAMNQSPEDTAVARQLGSALELALRDLPHEQREVAALWSVGFEIDVIATVVGAPRDSVISRKKYALSKLRHALGRQGIKEA